MLLATVATAQEISLDPLVVDGEFGARPKPIIYWKISSDPRWGSFCRPFPFNCRHFGWGLAASGDVINLPVGW